MSDSISNIRNVPVTRPVGRIRGPAKDEKSQDQEADRRKPRGGSEGDSKTEDVSDQDKPLVDEYA